MKNKLKAIGNILKRVRNTAFSGKRKGKKGVIVLMSALLPSIIRARLAMPRGALEFQRKSMNMRQAMINDTKGYFSLPFSTPFTHLAKWKEDNDAFLQGINASKYFVGGGKARKKSSKLALRITLNKVENYVNDIMLEHQDVAAQIAENVYMELDHKGSTNKQEIAVEIGNSPGEIKVRTLAPKYENGQQMRATYEREYSKDKGETWVSMQSNSKANDVAKGLESEVSHIFRKRHTTSRGGTTQWFYSKPITPD
jgi:hypothetical protein